MLIVFEGIEGSGKTTQAQLLAKALQALGHAVTLTREPGGTEIGQKIRELLLNSGHIPTMAELFLYQADRVIHVESVLAPAIARKEIVICDRFTDSTIAYQGYASMPSEIEMIYLLNNLATQGLQPDLTIYLTMPVKVAIERIQQRGQLDRMEQKDIDFHCRVAKGFAEIAAYHRNNLDNTLSIDATQSVEAIAAEILHKVLRLIVSQPGTQEHLGWDGV